MEIIFHVGMPKCASSSLQAHFADNDVLYAQHGFLYPTRHRLVRGYRNHNPLFEPELDQNLAADQILEEAQNKGCSRILISTEQFSTNRTGQLAITASAFAQKIGSDQISCLCLTRDPASMLRSGYQQFVRGGLWGIDRSKFYSKTDASIQAYIQAFRVSCGFEWYEYEQVILRTTLGVEARVLNVWDINSGPDLIERLTSFFDLPMGLAAVKKNPRLAPAKIKLLRQFQQDFGVEAYLQNRRLLIRKIDLSGIPMSNEDALEAGLGVSDAELHSDFPDLDVHFEKALSLDGIALTR